MALSNAERQRRHRAKQKELLRNADSGPKRTLARMLYDRYVATPEEYSIPDVSGALFAVAEDIRELISLDALSAVVPVGQPVFSDVEDEDPDRDAVRAFLGGKEYCAAVEKYFNDCEGISLRNKGKRANKREPMPDPPAVPEH